MIDFVALYICSGPRDLALLSSRDRSRDRAQAIGQRAIERARQGENLERCDRRGLHESGNAEILPRRALRFQEKRAQTEFPNRAETRLVVCLPEPEPTSATTHSETTRTPCARASRKAVADVLVLVSGIVKNYVK